MEQVGNFGPAKARSLTRRFWRTGLGFWRRGGDRAASLLTLGLLVIIGAQVLIQYELTVWNRAVFDALQQHDGHGVTVQAMVFPALAAVSERHRGTLVTHVRAVGEIVAADHSPEQLIHVRRLERGVAA